MELDEAKKSFTELLSSIEDTDKEKFLSWLTKWSTKDGSSACCQPIHNGDTHVSNEEKKIERKAEILLSCIKETLKEKVPFNGVMNSEEVSFPVIGSDVNLNDKNCIHVDAFLYDEEDVEMLVDSGKLHNHYCKDCLSSNVEPMTFISHSASKDRLRYIFKKCLPPLKDKVIVDVGSRLGVVLYAAHIYTEAKKIIGIEINRELCELQRHIVDKYKLGDRIIIREGDVMDMCKHLVESDIVILMNVFEWFLNLDDQLKVWDYLHKYIKPGTIIVAAPPIEISLELIGSKINSKRWLKETHYEKICEDFCEETEFRIYKVR